MWPSAARWRAAGRCGTGRGASGGNGPTGAGRCCHAEPCHELAPVHVPGLPPGGSVIVGPRLPRMPYRNARAARRVHPPGGLSAAQLAHHLSALPGAGLPVGVVPAEARPGLPSRRINAVACRISWPVLGSRPAGRSPGAKLAARAARWPCSPLAASQRRGAPGLRLLTYPAGRKTAPRPLTNPRGAALARRRHPSPLSPFTDAPAQRAGLPVGVVPAAV
jgi:hypothetical protein